MTKLSYEGWNDILEKSLESMTEYGLKYVVSESVLSHSVESFMSEPMSEAALLRRNQWRRQMRQRQQSGQTLHTEWLNLSVYTLRTTMNYAFD